MGLKIEKKTKAKKQPVKAKAPAKSNPVPRISKDEQTWRAEDDARTLMRAEEIRRDAARLRKAKTVAKAQAAAASRVAGL